jgi:DtxR family transcriptional regulator, Mn-dependent transcriptional regulator
MSPDSVSASLQDYLETILNLSRDGDAVRVTDIATSLNLAKASVSQALALLREQGLVEQERYGPVQLTVKGRQFASTVRRRHTVILDFLINVLGVSPATAEHDACLMEHAVSSETIEKLSAFMEIGRRG